MKEMSGWKTKLGVFLMTIGEFYRVLGGDPALADAMRSAGEAIAVLGIGHKIDKAGKL